MRRKMNVGLEQALREAQQPLLLVHKRTVFVMFSVSERPPLCLTANMDVDGPCSTLFLFHGHCLCSVGYMMVWLPAGMGFVVLCFHFLTHQETLVTSLMSLYLGAGCTASGGCLHFLGLWGPKSSMWESLLALPSWVSARLTGSSSQSPETFSGCLISYLNINRRETQKQSSVHFTHETQPVCLNPGVCGSIALGDSKVLKTPGQRHHSVCSSVRIIQEVSDLFSPQCCFRKGQAHQFLISY